MKMQTQNCTKRGDVIDSALEACSSAVDARA
jgi:hypothetical protein